MELLRPIPARPPLLALLILVVLLALGLGDPSVAQAQDAGTAQPVLPPAPPPAYTPPATPAPNGPLPGQDYPPPVQGSAVAGPATQPRPAGIDLDVTVIERTPRYERYQVVYDAGRPRLLAPNAQRWPAPGELVTFTARIANKGTQCSGPFRVAWFLDNVRVQENLSPGLCLAGATLFTWQWTWPYPLAGERLAGERLASDSLGQADNDHLLRVVVDPDNTVAETFETNNSLEDHTAALSFYVALSPAAYTALESNPVVGQPASAEDWLQRHVRALNDALAASRSPLTPNGVPVRIRLDKLELASGEPHPGPGYDGYWYVTGDYRMSSDYYHADQDLDWGLLHEWGHQLGLIDTYRYNVAADQVAVLRQDGSPFGAGYDFPGDALMETVGSPALGDYQAAALAQTHGLRRGYYGETQYALGSTVSLQVRDRDGCAVPGAAVAVYLRDAVSGAIDNTPEFAGSTDAAGAVTLPNRPAGGDLATATGFTLHDNPFGPIDVVGEGNLALIKLQAQPSGATWATAGGERFAWLSVPDLNLDFWRKGGPAAQTVYLALDYPAAGSACGRRMFDDAFAGPALDGGWRWIDPAADADVALDSQAGALVLRLYGGENDLRGATNFAAPRLVQPAGGNFGVTLGVNGAPPAAWPPEGSAAGLLLWQDADNFVRFEQANVAGRPLLVLWLRLGGEESEQVLADLPASGNQPPAGVALRVRRDGDRFRFAYQLPGAAWVEGPEHNLPLAADLLLGPFALSQAPAGAWQAQFDFIAWDAAVAGLSMPGDLSVAQAGKQRAAVSWQDTNSAEMGFRVERSTAGPRGPWTVLATLPPAAPGYLDPAAPCGVTLHYRVFAFDAVGDSPTGPVSAPFVADCTPVAPDGVAAAVQRQVGDQTDGAGLTVVVRWRDNSPDETGFAVQRSDDGGRSWPAVGIAVAGSTAWADGTATCEAQYLYRVAALNAFGSAPGPAVAVTTPSCGVTGSASYQLFLPTIQQTAGRSS